MEVQWWGYHEVVGTLKPPLPLKQKNLFELFALTGGRDTKTLETSAREIAQTGATW